LFANHLPELANFAAGSLLFGQFLSERPYSLRLVLVGLFSYAGLMGTALFFAGRGQR
jgi:hypothetical protein